MGVGVRRAARQRSERGEAILQILRKPAGRGRRRGSHHSHQRKRMVEPKSAGLNMASRRPQGWFGFLRSLDCARNISHQVAELELQNPVEALHDRKASPKQSRFITHKAFVRGVASQHRDEMLDREQDIDDVGVSLLADERKGIDRRRPNHIKGLATSHQVCDAVLGADTSENDLACFPRDLVR